MQTRVPFSYMRGGTSKGPFFKKSDLPSSWEDQKKFILAAMGSPDPSSRQIDGIGGGDSLSSKVAIIEKSSRPDADINYLVCQVHRNKPIVETKLNCGNILSAVGPFAIENNLIHAVHPETNVRIFNENTGVIIHALIPTPNGMVTYEGDTSIDGVPGTGAAIKLNFINAVGSKTKKLFPTGNRSDMINNIKISCLDVSVPMVIVNAKSLGVDGTEDAEFFNQPDFLAQLESIRHDAAILMGFGDVSNSVMPKICIVSQPRTNGHITSRYFDPFRLHSSHAVSGALCLASACLIPETVAAEVANISKTNNLVKSVTIEHPLGTIDVMIKLMSRPDGSIDVPEACFIRTARLLARGEVFVPAKCFHTSHVRMTNNSEN